MVFLLLGADEHWCSREGRLGLEEKRRGERGERRQAKRGDALSPTTRAHTAPPNFFAIAPPPPLTPSPLAIRIDRAL
jgi:hypothetical protein